MKNWVSKLFFLALGALVLAGLAFAFWPEPVLVDMARVKRDTLMVTVDEDGKTRIREKYVVSTPLSGRLLRIDLDPGDSVIAGQTLLAVIEPRDPELLDARAIAQSEARVRTAEASLRKVEPMLEQARLQQAQEERDLERYRRLVDSGGVTREELEAAETIYRTASEELRASRYAKEIAEFELEQAQAALLRSRPSEKAPPRVTPRPTAGTSASPRPSTAACCGCCKKAPPWSPPGRRCWSWATRPTWRSRSTSCRATR